MRLLVTAALALAGLLVTAAPVGARTAFDVRAEEEGRALYALAGERLLAYEPKVGRDPERLVLLEPGGIVRRLDDFDTLLAFDPPELRPDNEDGGYETTYWNLALGASSRRLAASVSLLNVSDDSIAPNYAPFADASRLWSRGVGKSAAPTDRCGPEEPNGLALQPIDVEGDVIAYGGGGCSSARASIGVVDFSTARPLRQTVLGPGQEVFSTVRLADSFVAGGTFGADRSTGHVVVFDRRSGSELYRVRGSPRLGDNFDLLADGRIVARDYLTVGDASLVWFSAQEPWAHPLPYSPCVSERPEAAGERFVMGRALTPPDVSGDQQCQWTLGTIESPAERPLFERGSGALKRVVTGFDGARVAVESPGCIGARVEIADPLAFTGSRPPVPACDFAVAARSDVTVGERGTLSVALRCPSSCRGTVRLRDAKSGRTLGLERAGRSVTAARFLRRGPRVSRLALRLDRRERDLVRRERRLAVAVEARVVQVDGGRRRFRAALALRVRPGGRP